ncbi:MAG: CDP-diacylglycerol--glycerol-3-phosphate 3-phosphatidyltransferase [Ruminococcaceae bacterium]|nr:CDP-diacylglycerol--glycerol-3-phosphate 3-phosphatidyltransferase [Oscillospiraceae bacterium]
MKNIPNILTVLRLFCVPSFICLFFLVAPVAALPVFLLAGLTDVLDGYLARKNGWTSTFGKVLDPIADKLMQCAVLICFAVNGYLSVWLALPFILKEVAQGILSIAMFQRRNVHTVSRWYGKAAVSIFYFAVSATILARLLDRFTGPIELSLLLLWILTLIFMLFAFTSYVVAYAKMAARLKKEWKGNVREDG